MATEDEKVVHGAVCDESCNDRREERAHRRWIFKTGFVTICMVIAVSVLTLIYAAVIQDKDFETGFIGESLGTLVEVLKLIM